VFQAAEPLSKIKEDQRKKEAESFISLTTTITQDDKIQGTNESEKAFNKLSRELDL